MERDPKGEEEMKRGELIDRLSATVNAMWRECSYASGWGVNRGENKKDSITDPFTGNHYTPMDWLVFAEKYIHEAKLAWANYTPDRRAVTVRLLKAGYLMLKAVAVTHTVEEIETLGGYSSSRYPVLEGGLQRMKDELQGEKK